MSHLHASILKRGPLSPKEAVVLRYLCEGYHRQEIANIINRTVSTISKQIESIAFKLDCHSAAEIVGTAVALGLVKIDVIHEHNLFIKFIACFLIVINISSGGVDMRRGPRSPRPVRTRVTASRVVRHQNQYS